MTPVVRAHSTGLSQTTHHRRCNKRNLLTTCVFPMNIADRPKDLSVVSDSALNANVSQIKSNNENQITASK